MLATQVILCVTVVGNAALFAVVLKERPSLTRTVFALYVASVAGWALTIYLNLFLRSLLVEDWIFAIAAGTLTAQLWFAKLFPSGKPPARLREYWSLAVGYFFMLASFYSGALFNSITVHREGYTTLDNGFLSAAYSLFALVYVCAPIVIFFRKYRAERDEKLRRQLRYLTIGFFLFAMTAVLTNSVLPVFFHFYALNAIGPSFSLVFAIFVFYIIGKHEFLDIRAAVQRGVMYSFLIALIVVAYQTVLLATERYVAINERLLALDSDIAEPITAAIVTIVGIFAAPHIERYFQKLTDQIFFKDRYDYAFALESLTEILNTSTDFDQLIERMEQSLKNVLRAESITIELYPNKTQAKEKYTAMIRERSMLFEPIVADKKEIGGILVSEKRSGDRYLPQDAQLLRTFSLQASTALARAQLFRQVQKHAIELEEKVAQRTAQLQEAHENERRMMLDIAHGLQTPLAVFQTRLETLRSSRGRTMDVHFFERSLAQLSDFVGSLLKLAQLEHLDTFRFENCPLSALVREISEECEVVAAMQGIKVAADIEPDITVRADPQELRSALMNLVANSIKYMRPNGPRRISIRLLRRKSHAFLSIQDTGMGIAAGDLPHIFGRFYRAGPAADISGNGLGLAISEKVVERHGGTIRAESTLGIGTTMTVELPCLAQTKAAA